MKKQNLNEMWRGWFIGNFEPSILKTENFEVGLLSHRKGEVWPKHYHAVATEYNLLYYFCVRTSRNCRSNFSRRLSSIMCKSAQYKRR